MALQRANRKGRARLSGGPGGRTTQVTGQTVELGAVHRLLDSDPTKIPSRYLIPINPSKYREEAGRLGGRSPWDFGGGDPAHVCAIPDRRLQRGL